MTKQVLIIAALAIFAPFANAQATTYFYCDTVLTVGGQCGIWVDAGAKVTNSTVVIGSIQTCRYDVTAVALGLHTYKCSAIAVNDPAFNPPNQESTQASITCLKTATSPCLTQVPAPANLRFGP